MGQVNLHGAWRVDIARVAGMAGGTVETSVLCVSESETLRQAGHRMRELGVTALRVRGADGKPRGTVSRDMIVRGIAAGGDPKMLTVGDLTAAGPYPATAGQAFAVPGNPPAPAARPAKSQVGWAA